MKFCACFCIGINPELTAVVLDQRAANRKPHADTGWLGGKKRLKYALCHSLIKTGPAILYYN